MEVSSLHVIYMFALTNVIVYVVTLYCTLMQYMICRQHRVVIVSTAPILSLLFIEVSLSEPLLTV